MREVLIPSMEICDAVFEKFLSKSGKDTDICILASASQLMPAIEVADRFNRVKNLSIKVLFMNDYPQFGWAIVNSLGSFVSHEEIK